MSSTNTEGTPENDDALAAEFVLGVLDPQMRKAVLKRQETEPAFAAMIKGWQEKLGQLDDEFTPVDPPKLLGKKIESRLFGETSRPPIWRNLPLWQGITAVLVVISVVLGGLAYQGAQKTPTPNLIAFLVSQSQELQVLASFRPNTRILTVNRSKGGPREGRDLELWVIIGPNAPVSLGVMQGAANSKMSISKDIAMQFDVGVILAISDEPKGGSTTGAPTGVVLAVGTVSML